MIKTLASLLIISSLQMAFGALSLTYVGGYEDFSESGSATGIYNNEPSTSKLDKWTGGTINQNGSLSVSNGNTANLNVSNGNKWANKSGCGSMIAMTISGLNTSTSNKQSLFSYSIGSGTNLRYTNFVLDTSLGLNNASFTMEFTESTKVAGTSTISGLDLSSDKFSIAFGYQRNSGDGGGNGHLFAMIFDGTNYSQMQFGGASVNFGNQDITNMKIGELQNYTSLTGVSNGDFTVDNAYVYIMGENTTLKTNADDVKNMLSEAYARSIPEPTTATLSLFGLGALLLRRRRTV